ncbi:2TM domain-containing protein [Lentibacillus salinarum]|uniref:2TM domain-containing protein n=1 Tax=Lentibacillus salinarum TaxID=446820 RepID=A0ABW3ZP45_9BACI
MEEDHRYRKAKEKVERLKAFYIHVTVYILVSILLLIINMITFDGYWWFLYPLGGWGIGVIIHGLTTFADGILGRDWEEKKIKKYLEKDRDNKH